MVQAMPSRHFFSRITYGPQRLARRCRAHLRQYSACWRKPSRREGRKFSSLPRRTKSRSQAASSKQKILVDERNAIDLSYRAARSFVRAKDLDLRCRTARRDRRLFRGGETRETDTVERPRFAVASSGR